MSKMNLRQLTQLHPTFISLIQEAQTYHIARDYVKAYMAEHSKFLFRAGRQENSLIWNQQVSCFLALQEIISLRSERISRFSIMKRLWQAVHRREKETDQCQLFFPISDN